MQKQKSRQLDRYKRYRPVDTEEYKKGVEAAVESVRYGIPIECPHYSDSGRYLRWTLGYTDELLRKARFNREFPLYIDAINSKVKEYQLQLKGS